MLILLQNFMVPLIRVGFVGLFSFIFMLFGAYLLTEGDDFGMENLEKP